MFTLNCRGMLLAIDRPLIMGIINVTPDSFYAASRSSSLDNTLERAEKMLGEGADILDVGGQSTRPGSDKISEEEELARVLAPIEAIHKRFPATILSIDTFYSRVAKACVDAGASIINDISAGTLDAQMIATAALLRVPYVLMHMRGTPQTMNEFANYENVSLEILDFFIQKKEECRVAGIHDIIIDPGFGFAKTIQQNFELLGNLSVFEILGLPIMAGVSRKATVYKTLGVSPGEALNGTTTLNTIALMNGANILRVHDVREAREAAQLFAATMGKKKAT